MNEADERIAKALERIADSLEAIVKNQSPPMYATTVPIPVQETTCPSCGNQGCYTICASCGEKK